MVHHRSVLASLTGLMVLLAWLAALTHAGAADAAQAGAVIDALPPPGIETRVTVPGIEGALAVFLPADYSPDQAWPVIFFYVWMGGTTTTHPFCDLTEGHDYIVVGVPYINPDPKAGFACDSEHLQHELRNFRLARTWIRRHAKVDEARFFLAGISKGGWATAVLGETEISKLAGMIIMLAGRRPYPDAPDALPAMEGKAVYLGAGETDPNLFAAIEGARFYGRQGARVTFEPYWGFGHAQPSKPSRLLAWLEAQGCDHDAAPEDRRARLDPLVQAKQVTALAEVSIADRYWQLRDLSDDPRLGFCSPSIRDAVRQALHEVARLPEAQAERGAERAFFDVTHNRNTARTLDQWRDLRDDWKTLTRMFPDTRYGKCAQRAYEEAADLCAEAEAKQQAASPDRPSTTSRPARSKQGESRRSSPKPPPPPRFR